MAGMKMVYQILDPLDTIIRFALGLGLLLAGIGVAVLQPIVSPMMVGTVGAVVGLILTIVALKDTHILKI